MTHFTTREVVAVSPALALLGEVTRRPRDAVRRQNQHEFLFPPSQVRGQKVLVTST